MSNFLPAQSLKVLWYFMLVSRGESCVTLFASYSTSNSMARLSASCGVCQTLLTWFKKTGNT